MWNQRFPFLCTTYVSGINSVSLQLICHFSRIPNGVSFSFLLVTILPMDPLKPSTSARSNRPGNPAQLTKPSTDQAAGSTIFTDASDLAQQRNDVLCEFLNWPFTLSSITEKFIRPTFSHASQSTRSPCGLPCLPPSARTWKLRVRNQTRLLEGKIDAVLLAVLSPAGKVPVERFVFRVSDRKSREAIADVSGQKTVTTVKSRPISSFETSSITAKKDSALENVTSGGKSERNVVENVASTATAKLAEIKPAMNDTNSRKIVFDKDDSSAISSMSEDQFFFRFVE